MTKGDQQLASDSVRKYSVVIRGHGTSISLEPAFHAALRRIARQRGQSLPALIAQIDARPRRGGLSSALRLFVLEHYMRAAGEMEALSRKA